MLVTDSGILRLANESQPSKAPYSMQVKELGIVKLTNDSQPLNACSPILTTESGIHRLNMDMQSGNARLWISAVPSGMRTASSLFGSSKSQSASCLEAHWTVLLLNTAITVVSG